MNQIDFKQLAEDLLTRAQAYCEQHIPGGKKVGMEWVAASTRGEKGQSFSLSLSNGKWSDFATGETGGDIISHYAARYNVRQIDAAKYLSEWLGNTQFLPAKRPVIRPAKPKIGLPPVGAPKPKFKSNSSQIWTYKTVDGAPLFHIERYETSEGKAFRPYSWDTVHKRWINKAYPSPRPLFGLENLNGSDKIILIPEGEKAALAARKLCGSMYEVITWPNGSASIDHVDWKPIYDRKILIWCDADLPGIKAGESIANHLVNHCDEIKIIYPSDDMPKGFDAADAVDKKWTYKKWVKWAKENCKTFKKTKVEVLPPKEKNISLQIVVSDDFDPPAPDVAKLLAEVNVSWQGKNPVCNSSNVFKILTKIEGELVWYDEFYNRFFTDNFGAVREWEDRDDVYLLEFFQSKMSFHKLSMTALQQGIMRRAFVKVKNEPKDWLKSLEWDKKTRIEEFCIKAFGCHDTKYTRGVSRNFWISLAARIMAPGIKVDNMMILEGPQGSLKSSALELIGGNWFAEIDESVNDKDFFVSLQGKILVELSELDAINKAEVASIKKIITRKTDRFRMPYGRASKDFPRSCIFVGSTNDDCYLRDVTGARRFWPLMVMHIDLKYIKENRDQLFAEARTLYSNDVPWWIMPTDETEHQQELRRSYDEWEHLISDEYEGNLLAQTGLSISTIAKEALDIPKDRLEKRVQIRIANCLKMLGWKKKHTRTGTKWARRNVLTDD